MKYERLVFINPVLRNKHLFISINNKVAAEIIDTFAVILFADSLHLTENTKLGANHNRNFADVNIINGFVKLLNHPIFISIFSNNMDVDIDTARI